MTALSWLALAAAVLLVPVPASAPLRARALGGRAAGVRGRPSGQLIDRLFGQVLERMAGRSAFGRPATSALAVGLVGAVAVAAAVAGGPALGLAAVVAGLTSLRLGADAVARRSGQRRNRDLLTAVRLLVAELEAGSRGRSALQAAAEAAPPYAARFASAARAAADGTDVAAALAGDPALASLAQAWRVAEDAGVPLAAVLAGVAHDLAARAEQTQAVAVALSAARSTAMLLAGLPLLGIGLGAAMGARPLPFLLQTPSGRLACCAGVVLDALGLLWTRRLARRAESS